ncbi:MAG: T9SS type A sorting domain-containing protein [Flavobacterium sp.]|nr:T9SS type A sorting domain-containing protein [Flavobacterium sp.]
MKRKLLLSLLAILTFGFTQAQDVVSIVGSGVNGWPGAMTGDEIDLTPIGNGVYTISNLEVTSGEIKFRLNHDWATNWGNNASVLADEFPAGTATLNAGNIQTLAGTYDVTFDINTLNYSFVGSSSFFDIGVWGPAVNPTLGYDGPDVSMMTNDGVNYILSAFNFATGPAMFRQDDDSAITWGDLEFPVGVAYPDGPAILVEEGLWTVRFERMSGEYSFEHPSIGIIGTAVNGWESDDTDMTTTDGITYTLFNQTLTEGVLKFRQDDMWTVSWGGTIFPAGQASDNDLEVVPGTYNITFNRADQTYNFTPSLSVNESRIASLSVYPNPTENSWNFNADDQIQSILILDVTGKAVLSTKPMDNQTTIDASELESGLYFAKIATASQMQTVKLIKK